MGVHRIPERVTHQLGGLGAGEPDHLGSLGVPLGRRQVGLRPPGAVNSHVDNEATAVAGEVRSTLDRFANGDGVQIAGEIVDEDLHDGPCLRHLNTDQLAGLSVDRPAGWRANPTAGQ